MLAFTDSYCNERGRFRCIPSLLQSTWGYVRCLSNQHVCFSGAGRCFCEGNARVYRPREHPSASDQGAEQGAGH